MTDETVSHAALGERIAAVAGLPLDERVAELAALEAVLRESLGSSEDSASSSSGA